ncbi:MAG: FHA domain-containing protein, partial [Candidatus Binataceae bacterium]
MSEKRADVPGPNSPNQSDTLRLVALGAAAPRVLELRSARVTVGTAASNDLQLDEPTASRRHAALERRGGRWHVADLGSTNGTYINGRRVTAPTPLQRGDELRFANARFACVAPGDDLSKVCAGSEKTGARSRGRGVRRASAIAAVLLCAVGGFA